MSTAAGWPKSCKPWTPPNTIARMKMKITDLKCAVIDGFPVVRIVTDEGIDGYGQAEASKPYLKPHVLFYRDKILDPPVIIYVYHAANEDFFVEKENYAAVVAAMQNISLAGVAEDLAVTWDTGRVTRVPAVDQVLGAGPDLKVMTVLSIGYADEESQASRTPVTAFARWL